MFNQKTDKITAAFQKPLNAKRQPVNLYDPHSPVPEEMMPGPGAYSLTSENTHKKPSAAFVEGNVDRFGKPVKVHKILEVLPGPGTYTQTDEPSASEITSAAFKDEQKRMYFEVKKLPGPAFYSPVPVAVKKSFHMNFNNTWV